MDASPTDVEDVQLAVAAVAPKPDAPDGDDGVEEEKAPPPARDPSDTSLRTSFKDGSFQPVAAAGIIGQTQPPGDEDESAWTLGLVIHF